MDGVLLVNKPKGMTSRDVVNQVGKIYGTTKVGHCGTLDPLATGVLVLCIGKYTKLVDLLTSHEKEYVATMRFGIETDTGDITGNILKEDFKTFSKEEILFGFQQFPREYEQQVPMYSAVKINGKKLYEYAREGIPINRPSRKVFLSSFEVLTVDFPDVVFKTFVSKGTYIRSLIEDIANSLGAVATMTELVRTKSGNFCLEDCSSFDTVTKDTPLLSILDLFFYPKVSIDEELFQKVLNGNKISLDETESRVILMYQNEAIAIYEKTFDCYRMIFKVV